MKRRRFYTGCLVVALLCGALGARPAEGQLQQLKEREPVSTPRFTGWFVENWPSSSINAPLQRGQTRIALALPGDTSGKVRVYVVNEAMLRNLHLTKCDAVGVFGDTIVRVQNPWPPSPQFVSLSPLPSTGVGWDYKYQLQVNSEPNLFDRYMSPFFSRDTGQQLSLSCADYGGKFMVEGLKLHCNGLIEGQPTYPAYHTVTIVFTRDCPSPYNMKVEKKFVLEVKGPSK